MYMPEFLLQSLCSGILLALAISPASAQAPPPGYVDLETCFVTLIDDIDVPAQVSGPLIGVFAVDGQFVRAGEQLARVDDQIAQVQLQSATVKKDAALARASDDVEIRFAEATYQVAEKEREINADLRRKNALTAQEYDRSKLAAEQAALQIERSQHEMDVAQKDAKVEEYNVGAAEQFVARHTIRSPIDGNVMEVYRQTGEWVKEGDQVMRVARMDRLRVDGLLPANQFNPHEISGRPVTVTLSLARGEQVQFAGQIVFVGLEQRGGSRFAVRAEVDNRLIGDRWLLLPGSDVQMRIHLDSGSARNAGTNYQK